MMTTFVNPVVIRLQVAEGFSGFQVVEERSWLQIEQIIPTNTSPIHVYQDLWADLILGNPHLELL